MKPGYKVKLTLNSSKGKEPLYKKFGFTERPNEDAGAAMDECLTPETQIVVFFPGSTQNETADH